MCIIFYLTVFCCYLFESCSISYERQIESKFGGGGGREIGVEETEEICNQDVFHEKEPLFHKREKNSQLQNRCMINIQTDR